MAKNHMSGPAPDQKSPEVIQPGPSNSARGYGIVLSACETVNLIAALAGG
jgi:hypothetical protein